MRTRSTVQIICCMGIMLGSALIAHAQDEETKARDPDRGRESNAAAPAAGSIGRASLLRVVTQANPMLWPLVACSIVMVAYIFERSIALRRGRVLPKEFARRFLERLGQGKLDRERASELCKANDSPLAHVFGHAVRYWGQPAATIRQAIDHDAASEIVELRKNVRMLNATATIAPLLGLLGTVIGMVESFDAVGSGRSANAAKSEALAHGISLALLMTGLGLAVAIVSVAFYYYFLQRIDSLARGLDDQANLVIDQIAAETLRPMAARGPILPSTGQELGPIEQTRPRTLGRVDTA